MQTHESRVFQLKLGHAPNDGLTLPPRSATAHLINRRRITPTNASKTMPRSILDRPRFRS